jgi:hypothetical protein
MQALDERMKDYIYKVQSLLEGTLRHQDTSTAAELRKTFELCSRAMTLCYDLLYEVEGEE